MSRSLRAAVVGAALLTLLPLAIASAHAELDSASPGPDEVIEGSPTRLVARFTQDIAADRTSIEVRDADGRTIARGGKDPDRPRVQRVDLPPLAPGTYEVRWVTFSTEDDELARGRYRFTVTAVPATPVPMPSAAALCPSPVVPAASSPPPASPASVASAAAPATPAPLASQTPLASSLPTLTPIVTPDPCAPATPAPSAAPSPASSTSPSSSVLPGSCVAP